MRLIDSPTLKHINEVLIVLSEYTFTASLHETPAKDAWSEFNHGKTSDKPNVRDINQNSWPGVFKSVKVLRVKTGVSAPDSRRL